MRTRLLFLMLAWTATAEAQTPVGTAFTYQGRLTDGGSPANGSYDLQFELFDAATGGSSVGGPLTSNGVSVVGGLFTVSLDFGSSAFAGQARWLEIGVKPAGALPPFTILGARQELTPSPNAVFSSTVPWTGITGKPAGFADDIDNDSGGDITDVTAGTGLTGGGTSGAVTLNVDLAGSGSATTVSRSDHDHFSQSWSGSAANGLTITNAGGGAVRGLSTATANGTVAVYGETIAPFGYGLFGNATSTAAGTFPIGVYGTSFHGYGVYGSASDGAGVAGVAFATTGFTAGMVGASQSPDGVGMYGQAYATSGFAIGVRGDTASPAGIAVWGYSTSTDSTGFPIGTEGRSDSPIGIGVNGFAAATSGANFGVRGASNSSDGVGVYGRVDSTTGFARGVLGQSASSAGVGVWGLNTAVNGTGLSGGSGATSGSGVGIRAVTNGPTGTGLFASAQGANQGQNFGVWGESGSTQGVGVHGQAWATSGFANGVWGRSYAADGNGVVGQAMSTTGQAWGVYGVSSSTAGVGVYGQAGNSAGAGVGTWGRTSASGGYGGYFENTSGGPALGVSAGGIRFADATTQTTAAVNPGADITGVIAGTGLTGGGTSGDVTLNVDLAGSGAATTVARSDHNHFLQTWSGSAAASPGFRVVNTGSSGFSDGLWGQSDATGGGRGVVGYTTATSGDNYGVWGQTDSTTGRGVFGLAAAASGTNYGVSGATNSSFGYGVYGENNSLGYGIYGVGYAGVWGLATGTTGVSGGTGLLGVAQGTSGVNYGVYGSSASSAGYAGYFSGRVNVTGTLSKGGGSFKIDHPLDPQNKYLYHSFVESPDMMNIYNGNVTTDDTGHATVELPKWFEALNRDFRYQLTVIGQFAQAIVSEEIAENRFGIRTDKPGVKVSWQVTGIRHDAFAEKHRIPVEEDKSDEERGTYLYPEAFGLPRERGLDSKRSPMALEARRLEQPESR